MIYFVYYQVYLFFMEISLIVAKVLGIYMVISGLVLIFRQKTVAYLLRDFFNHPAVVYLTGVILVFLSSLFLLQNNIWDFTWRTVVTIFVWSIFVKGLAYIFVPEMLHKMVNKKMFGNLGVHGFFSIVIGMILWTLG